ncbi:hypothetical protein H4R26_000450 [Coemansia thaxteri]|uniref:Uncharacterized protein n=1 Tax=Coemansia thaxteri TaxID=2663907 RepID=A0A9W8BNM3_9FUNG|nr:hypothetical protein H4R26_000450 [Coemansia thaxteri]
MFSTGAMLGVRATLFVYTLGVWIYTIVYDAQHGKIKGHFVYFTNLAYTGLVGYLGSSTFHTLQLWRRNTSSSFTSMPATLQLLHWLLYDSVMLFATVVTVLFWSLIYKASDYTSAEQKWLTVSAHALNSCVLVDMLAGCMLFSPHWSHSLTLTIIVLLYVALAYINEAVNGWFTYDFLDYKKHKTVVAPVVIGMFVGFILVYYAMYGLQLLLERLLPPRFASRTVSQDEQAHNGSIHMALVNQP